jgi:hypothetical protein
MNQEIKETPVEVQKPIMHDLPNAEMPVSGKAETTTGDAAPHNAEVEESKQISKASLIIITCLVMLCNLTQVSHQTLHHYTQQN